MKSICFFASYFNGENIPYYITIYLKELKKQFENVVLLTSQKKISEQSKQFLIQENIQFSVFENEGFDFGLWYKAFQSSDLSPYDQIVLVNDSCILFKPLDEFTHWSVSNKAELQGITRSDAVAPHIQSYFLIINKKAIGLVLDYFNKHKVLKTIEEVIRIYEIGLSSYLISNGLQIAAFVDNNGYKGEFSPYYHCINYHLAKGIPVIKKKIMFSSYRKEELFTLARMNFNISPTHYIQLIQKNATNCLIDFEKLKIDAGVTMTWIEKAKYNVQRAFIHLFRPLYKIIKNA